MEEGKVKEWYDKSVDIFYMHFEERPSHEVVEWILIFVWSLTRTRRLGV